MIKVYSTKTCVYCSQVIKFLEHNHVSYEKVMLDDDPELRQALFLKTGAMTVPITMGDTGSYVIGYNITKLKELISQGDNYGTKIN